VTSLNPCDVGEFWRSHTFAELHQRFGRRPACLRPKPMRPKSLNIGNFCFRGHSAEEVVEPPQHSTRIGSSQFGPLELRHKQMSTAAEF
jgi:hypothetical protein